MKELHLLEVEGVEFVSLFPQSKQVMLVPTLDKNK